MGYKVGRDRGLILLRVIKLLKIGVGIIAGYKVTKNRGLGISVDCLAFCIFCIFFGGAMISSYCKSIAFVMQKAIIYNALKSTMRGNRVAIHNNAICNEWQFA